MLDEKALRKPGFTEGPKVTLGDGQEWTFPEPWLRLYPTVTDGVIGVGGGMSFGPEYDDLVDDYLECGADDDAAFRRHELQFKMAAGLLLLNYDLTNRHLRVLLASDAKDERGPGMWEKIRDVVMGIVPKPSAGGSD